MRQAIHQSEEEQTGNESTLDQGTDASTGIIVSQLSSCCHSEEDHSLNVKPPRRAAQSIQTKRSKYLSGGRRNGDKILKAQAPLDVQVVQAAFFDELPWLENPKDLESSPAL